MAEVHDASGVPSVAPDTRAPDDYQRISATPESFGAAIGRGLERAGQGGSQAADNLFNMAAFQGRVNVDDQINHVMQGSSAIRHGEPGKTVLGPDGKPQPDAGFMGLVGRAALDRREDTVKSLDTLIEQGRKNLKSEQEQLEYDTQTRRMRSIWYDEIGRHADGQFRTWGAHVNTAGAKLALDHIAAHADNPEEVAHGAADLINFKVKDAQLKGGGDEQVREAIADGKREAFKAQVEAIAVKDPARALGMLDKNREIAGTQYHALASSFRVRAAEQTGTETGQRVLNDALAPPAGPLDDDTKNFFRARSNARVDGLHPDFAGRLKQATADFEAATGGQARFQSLARTNAEQAALHAKYVNGSGGLAAPPGQSRHEFGMAADVADGPFLDWLHQNANRYGLEFLSGKNFRDDPGHVQLAGKHAPAAAGGPLPPEKDVLRRVFDDPALADDVHARTAAITEVKRYYDAHQVATANYNVGFDQRLHDTLAQADATGSPGTPLDEDEFTQRYGPEAGAIHYANYQAELDLANKTRTLASLSPSDTASLLTDLRPRENTPGYADALKRHERVLAAAQKLDEAKQRDPAQYALQFLPAVQGAWREFQGLAASPTAAPAAKQAAAQKFAATTLSEQARVGVPEIAQQILPKGFAGELKKEFAAAGGSDDPQARLSLVGRVKQQAELWGSAWPAVMRQLAPDVSPMVRAIAAGADPEALSRLLGLPKGQKNPSEVLKEQSDTKATDLNKEINDVMAPFRRTLVGRQRDVDEPGYFNLARELGALYVRDGDSANVAATKAFNALIGGRYEFRDTWRIPKTGTGVTVDDVQKGTVAARSQLRAAAGGGALSFDVAEAADDAGLREGNRADSLTRFARDGKFVTSYDNAGLNLVYDGKFIRRGNGAPVLLTWAELATLGKPVK